MRPTRSAASILAALALFGCAVGCSLIDLDDLSEAAGGAAASSTGAAPPATTSTVSGASTSTKSTSVTAPSTIATTASADASTDTGASVDASASSGGCQGPTFCAGSTAQFCDDFDSAASQQRWTQTLFGVAPPDGTIEWVDAPYTSCPTAAKASLHVSYPNNTYVQLRQYYAAGGGFGAYRVALDARKEAAPPDASGIFLETAWQGQPDAWCQITLYDDGHAISLYAQRFQDGAPTYLTNAWQMAPTPTLGRWVHHVLTVDPGDGALSATYTATLDDGTTMTFDVPDAIDAVCGASSYDVDVEVFLGNHYDGSGPNVSVFDDVELTFDP